ncbi:hypothetical protein [Hydrogenophaga sp.]|uniref:hypothetical protein n=1 Tax=Hydrogenophaga sp. TaxID=1904254 RepID=UPI0026127F62|nr:hypothetical protein [Hydrogenophaga sp.]
MYRQMDFRLFALTLKTVFPGAQPNGTNVRKLFSRLNQQHNIGLPPRSIGQRDVSKPEQLRIATWFSEGRSLRLLARGPAACALLAQHATAIQAALNAEAGIELPLTVEHGDHGVEPVLIPRAYVIPRMLMGHASPNSTWGAFANQVDAGAKWMELAGEQVAKKIAEGIVTQCFDLLDAGDTVKGEHAKLVQVHWDRITNKLDTKERGEKRRAACEEILEAMDLRVTAIAKHSTYLSSGPKGLCVMLRDIRITTPSMFLGEWMVGHERDAGIGSILEDDPTASKRSHQQSTRKTARASVG